MIFRYWVLGLFFINWISCQFPTEKKELDHAPPLAILQLENSQLLASVVANGLEVPWDIVYGADGWLWVNEQKGTISRINPQTGEKKILKKIEDVLYKRSRGLLSLAVHPQFERNPYVYAHYVYGYKEENLIEVVESRLVRYTYRPDTLIAPLVLLDKIPGKTYHNGSRILITPDLKLFFAMGDAGNLKKVQDWADWRGKILRMNLDGSIPTDNPFPNSYVWSKGHRNPQGLTWGNQKLYESEHGTNKEDEINIIKKKGNYGWNTVEGYCDTPSEKIFCQDSAVIEPLKTWTPTLAVAGMEYYGHAAIPEWNNSLILSNLKGRALRVLQLNEAGTAISEEKIYFQKYLGRIRDVAVAPNGEVYLATSNTDWHPRIQTWMYDTLPPGKDRIIRLNPIKNNDELARLTALNLPTFQREMAALVLESERWDNQVSESQISLGKQLYLTQCASCHRPDGKGTEGLIPPLANTDWVTGDRTRLINILLQGLSDPIVVNGVQYEQEMPAYAALDDEQIAAIINYIRTNFGNKARMIRAKDVREERRGLLSSQ